MGTPTHSRWTGRLRRERSGGEEGNEAPAVLRPDVCGRLLRRRRGGADPCTAAGRVRPGRGRGASVEVGCGTAGWVRVEQQPVVERPALPGPLPSNRGGRGLPCPVAGRGRCCRMPDLSTTGAREENGRGGGYLEDAAASCLREQEGRAHGGPEAGCSPGVGRMRRRTGTVGQPCWRPGGLCPHYAVRFPR